MTAVDYTPSISRTNRDGAQECDHGSPFLAYITRRCPLNASSHGNSTLDDGYAGYGPLVSCLVRHDLVFQLLRSAGNSLLRGDILV